MIFGVKEVAYTEMVDAKMNLESVFSQASFGRHDTRIVHQQI